jgi:integrase/recombinase XerD
MYNHIVKITPYFKLRILGSREKKCTVVCEVHVKGTPVAIPFSTGVMVYISDWDYKQRRVNLNDVQSRMDNQRLDTIQQELTTLANKLQYQGNNLTARLLKETYLEKPLKIPSFLDCLAMYLENRTKSGITKSTLGQYKSFQNIITKYLESIGRKNIELESFKENIWENLKENSQRNEISNHVLLTFIKSIFKYAVKKGYLTYHEMLSADNPKGYGKELVWFDETQIDRLMEHRFMYEPHERVRKAFLFQCYSGLAFEEIRTFKKSENLKMIGGKPMMMIFRKKTRKHYPVPLLKQAKEILETIEESFNLTGNYEYNISLRFLGEIMKYPKIGEITSHMGRKTAGVYLLNNGVPIEVVSKILGHQDIQTTQDYYCTVLTKYIDVSTLHLQ